MAQTHQALVYILHPAMVQWVTSAFRHLSVTRAYRQHTHHDSMIAQHKPSDATPRLVAAEKTLKTTATDLLQITDRKQLKRLAAEL